MIKERTLAIALLTAVALGAFLLLSPGEPETVSNGRNPSRNQVEPRAPKRIRRQPPPAGPNEMALLAPLEIGAELAEWEVKFIGAVDDGRLSVVLSKDGAFLRLEVVLASPDAPEPPAATRRYHIYYRAQGVLPEEGAELARKLAEIIAKNGHVSPPAGMSTYEDPGRDPWAEGM